MTTPTARQPRDTDPALLTVAAAAELLGMSERALYDWEATDDFPLTSRRIGTGRGRLRFSRAQILRYLNGEEL